MFTKSLYSKSNLIRKDLVEEGGRRFSSPHHAIKVLFFAKGKNLAVKMYLDGRSYYPVRKNTYDGHLGLRFKTDWEIIDAIALQFRVAYFLVHLVEVFSKFFKEFTRSAMLTSRRLSGTGIRRQARRKMF